MSTSPTFAATHPRQVLFDAGEAPLLLPACDHYAGTEALIRKSLALQQEMGDVFDLTLDCEDGAPVGGEAEHVRMVAELVDEKTQGRSQVFSPPSGGLAQSDRSGGSHVPTQGRPQVFSPPSGGLAQSDRSGGSHVPTQGRPQVFSPPSGGLTQSDRSGGDFQAQRRPGNSADVSAAPPHQQSLAVGRSRLMSHGQGRLGVRVHAASHPAFVDEVKTLLSTRADHGLAYVMVPKVRDLAEVEAICAEIDRQCALGALASGLAPEAHKIPIHVLIETHGALRDVQAIAAHPRVELLAFGLMDFVSTHRGAIPASAMSAQGQFAHPLVVRAKLEIAAACHAHGKTPSHCVVTEFKSLRAVATAALRAANEFGYLRMWSIHPRQIRPIVEAFAPSAAETEHALEIIRAAEAASWAPTRYTLSGQARLHDRASYRYYWQVIERARRTGQALPTWAEEAWF
jgi:citrate lyase subunit beta / citryl-CoA lyase